MSEILICDYCGKGFTGKRSRGGGNAFCSDQHRALYAKDKKRNQQKFAAIRVIGQETGLDQLDDSGKGAHHRLNSLDANAMIQAVKAMGYKWNNKRGEWVKPEPSPDNDPSRYDRTLFDDIEEQAQDKPLDALNMPDDIKNQLDNGAHLVVSVSGGKDSDCTAIELNKLRQLHNWTGRFILLHADVGRMEWKQSKAHCQQLAQGLNAEYVVVKHSKRELMDAIYNKMDSRPDAPPFPSSAARYCTSDYKRAVIDKWIRNEFPENASVISAIGFRADESPDRAKKPCFAVRSNCEAQSKNRQVLDWHPVLNYSKADVWQTIGYTLDELQAIVADVRAYWSKNGNEKTLEYIQEIGFKAHPAYALGNERVSCALCVLASKNDLDNGARMNPELHSELISIEDVSGFTFKQGFSLKEIGA